MPATPEEIGTLYDLSVFGEAAARFVTATDWLDDLGQALLQPAPVTVRPADSVVCTQWTLAAPAGTEVVERMICPPDLTRLRVTVWALAATTTAPQLHGSATATEGTNGVPLGPTPLVIPTRGGLWVRNLDTAPATVFVITESIDL